MSYGINYIEFACVLWRLVQAVPVPVDDANLPPHEYSLGLFPFCRCFIINR